MHNYGFYYYTLQKKIQYSRQENLVSTTWRIERRVSYPSMIIDQVTSNKQYLKLEMYRMI